MIVEKRDPTLKYPPAIKDEKTRLVLDWLLEFRFSSVEILSKRIGQTPMNSNRFFNSLKKDGVLQEFKNVHTKNQRYLIMTSVGVSYLEALGRDISKAVTRVSNLGKYSHIIHDLSVQFAIVTRLHNYCEVIADKNIQFGEKGDRPDAILATEKDGRKYWSAIEFERWRKDNKRIYLTFKNHANNFANKEYTGVIYIFQQEADCKHYEKLFNESMWPTFSRTPKSGQLRKLSNDFNPDEIPKLRDRYVFQYDPISF
ncbi:hypothetical protein [Algicola sagamiensis]|uniref:hypothetical protein n=1 Tax=Algicola sagamiensis TaxID=163869 RepID=UPI00037AD8F1|nr:hypothetical protein [Algicola sagamiensis]